MLPPFYVLLGDDRGKENTWTYEDSKTCWAYTILSSFTLMYFCMSSTLAFHCWLYHLNSRNLDTMYSLSINLILINIVRCALRWLTKHGFNTCLPINKWTICYGDIRKAIDHFFCKSSQGSNTFWFIIIHVDDHFPHIMFFLRSRVYMFRPIPMEMRFLHESM